MATPARAPGAGAADETPAQLLRTALASVPANLAALAGQLGDPLGLRQVAIDDVAEAAAGQDIALDTVGRMRQLFHGDLGAFSYLLFILLYMPCVATIGAIYKEIGAFWAAFSTLWSLAMAHSAAVICYQLGVLPADPASALPRLAAANVLAGAAFALLLAWGRSRAPANLIPLVRLD